MVHRFLLLDAGNTRLKAAIYEGGKSVESWVFQNHDLKEASGMLNNSLFEAVMVSNTAADEVEFKSWFPSHPVFFLNESQYNGIKWAYANPQTIGKDRLAALIGASKLHPDKNISIVDAGTCLTIDFLSKDRNHLGGIISPGLKMRLSAMHHFTGKLPEVSENEMIGTIGKTTESCMAAGAVMGMIAEIEFHLLHQNRMENSTFELILTGGDAIFLAHRLKPANFVVPDIVFQGMNAVLAGLV
jgi:type III pantothenate kinase